MNLILDTDSYKASHFLQYPPNTTYMFSYLESRGGKYPCTLFFGLQYILKKYLTTIITEDMVYEASEFFKSHGEPFNLNGWLYIANKLGGKLPVRIRAVKEGTLVPVSNVLMTIESTDPEVFWIVSWLETMLMRVWYPTTVATQSYSIKKLIMECLEKTSDNPDAEILHKLHDFGSRGVSSQESAGIGGAGHLVNFLGSDNVAGIVYANKYYNMHMAGFSIPAAEHSTITMWGRSRECEAYRNMIEQYKTTGMLAVVSDSYDLYDAIEHLWGGELKNEVIASGATIVIRPDSGHPASVVLNCVILLADKFGITFNNKGYKVLNHVRVLQGDGINEDSIREILNLLINSGFSATNVAFGMGGALLQHVNRDTQEFAFKCSSATVDGKCIDVYKSPSTDSKKQSKRGKLDLVRSLGEFKTISGTNNFGSELHVVYENGVVMSNDDLTEIRHRACMI